MREKEPLSGGALNNTLFAAAGELLALLQALLAIRLLDPHQMGEYAVAGLSNLIRLMSFQAFGGVCRLPLFLLFRDLKYFQHRVLLSGAKSLLHHNALTRADRPRRVVTCDRELGRAGRYLHTGLVLHGASGWLGLPRG